jgi:DNA-binding NarL/FixJ family response regulator
MTRYVMTSDLDHHRPLVYLSGREVTVMQLIAQGWARDKIAKELGISPHTVRSHVQNVLEELCSHSQAHAVAVLMRMGKIQ